MTQNNTDKKTKVFLVRNHVVFLISYIEKHYEELLELFKSFSEFHFTLEFSLFLLVFI